jgi:hypothetical protein
VLIPVITGAIVETSQAATSSLEKWE